MKDKEARWEIEQLREKVVKLSYRDCPKCKHLTIQLRGDGYPKEENVTYAWDYQEWDYLCLVCGSQIALETIAKVIE